MPGLLVAAHELKAPLSIMRQIGLVLADEETTSEDRKLYQNQLILTADRALRLVSDLAQVSNIQPSLFPLEPVNPFAVCQAVSTEMRSIEKLYERKIDWPKPRPNVLAVANASLLERVVANFIDNAIKYTDPDSPIRVQIRNSIDTVRVGVRDYGPKMSISEYARLVDELEKTKTTKTRPESSGLGVFLAARFAKAMQGQIGLIRHRDGLTFYVEMPVSRQMSFA